MDLISDPFSLEFVDVGKMGAFELHTLLYLPRLRELFGSFHEQGTLMGTG